MSPTDQIRITWCPRLLAVLSVLIRGEE
uniref:Uncharacterized protein n=1 Tax=Anguilla anguilla TaxID=7936 RepID=A0A0E9S583_ANGAN